MPNDPGIEGLYTTIVRSLLCIGLERLVWTVRGEAATPPEPQPQGNEATGWLVSVDGRPKLSMYRHPQMKQTVMC